MSLRQRINLRQSLATDRSGGNFSPTNQTTMSNETALSVTDDFQLSTTSGSLMLAGGKAFEHIQRVAKMFSSSDLVPKEFQGKVGNCVIALEMAHRMGANPMAVMQNLYIVHGKPGWSAQFIIACLNQCGKFSPLRFKLTGDGETRECIAWAIEKETNERLEGPPVSMKIAKAEGWLSKSGSKWQTMPELMLRYRAATFFGRLYAPDLLMGMQTAEELSDVREVQNIASANQSKLFNDPPALPDHSPLSVLMERDGVTWEELQPFLTANEDPAAHYDSAEILPSDESERLAAYWHEIIKGLKGATK